MEKFQVQLVTVAALAVVYLGLWPLFRGSDPSGPVTFLSNGSLAEMGLFAVVFWALACVCAAVTITGRPEGAMIAMLIGAGGLALRSGQIRTLLWSNMANGSALYGRLAVEVLILAAVVAVGSTVIGLVRLAASRVRPRWLWRDPLAEPGGMQTDISLPGRG